MSSLCLYVFAGCVNEPVGVSGFKLRETQWLVHTFSVETLPNISVKSVGVAMSFCTAQFP